jgi:hypothetical protein
MLEEMRRKGQPITALTLRVAKMMDDMGEEAGEVSY